MDAYRTRTQVVNAVLGANRERWPRFAEALPAPARATTGGAAIAARHGPYLDMQVGRPQSGKSREAEPPRCLRGPDHVAAGHAPHVTAPAIMNIAAVRTGLGFGVRLYGAPKVSIR